MIESITTLADFLFRYSVGEITWIADMDRNELLRQKEKELVIYPTSNAD